MPFYFEKMSFNYLFNWVTFFPQIMKGPLKNYLEFSKIIGGEVSEQSILVENAFKAQRVFLDIAANSKKPSGDQVINFTNNNDDNCFISLLICKTIDQSHRQQCHVWGAKESKCIDPGFWFTQITNCCWVSSGLKKDTIHKSIFERLSKCHCLTMQKRSFQNLIFCLHFLSSGDVEAAEGNLWQDRRDPEPSRVETKIRTLQSSLGSLGKHSRTRLGFYCEWNTIRLVGNLHQNVVARFDRQRFCAAIWN